jgi:hydrogenase nickel incorporation protein HypA/HybF
MHELSIALSILEFASDEAAARGGTPVLAIHLKLGPLSGVVETALRLAHEVARDSVPFVEKAELIVEQIPVEVVCPACQAKRIITSIQHLCCSVCGTPTPQVTGGRDLEVTALEFPA